MLTSVLFLGKLSFQQEPDRFRMEQEPDRFRMEQEPDRFRMEQEPDILRMEQEPDRLQMEQEPDKFQMEQDTPDRFQMEQEPDRFRMEQEPDSLRREQQFQMEQEPDQFQMEQEPDQRFEQETPDTVRMQKETLYHQAVIKPKTRIESNYERRARIEDDYRSDIQAKKSLDGFRTSQQGRKGLDGFRSAAMGGDLLDELVNMQKEGHTNPQKGGSKKKPKKITFAENVDMKALVARLSRDEIVESEGDEDDDALNQWVMVTSEGYEYTAQQEDVERVLQEESTAETSGYTESSFDVGEEQLQMQAAINATAQRVLGYDSRYQVNARYYPFSAMGRVQSGCTGTFIGPRHILTAGHCVYNPYRRTWYRYLNFQRAKNCYPNQGTYYRWKYAITVSGWIRGYRAYDYAVIAVTSPSPTWMGFGYRNPMPRYYVSTGGYPFDKNRQCMWRSRGYLDRRYTNWMTHRCDTYNGMSGGPIYVGYRIYGVHVGSYGSRRNMAIRINRCRFKTLLYIMRYYR